jgi:DNA (cytosine-5)-methyltransferase 1
MTRPRLLDLFCGAGGAAMGYHRAGFDVVGVDIKPQPHYPFEFHQADALEVPLDGWDAIHASPPCQAYSMMTRNFGTADRHPRLIGPTRQRLQGLGAPWVIENVPGAPLRPDIKLCGCMFGLAGLRRDRWFETSWHAFAMVPGHDHTIPAITITGHGMTAWSRAQYGRELTPDEKRRAMGVDWYMNTWELAEAIPPAYTKFIGEFLMAKVRERVA